MRFSCLFLPRPLAFRDYGTEVPRLWIKAENDCTKYTTKSSILLPFPLGKEQKHKLTTPIGLWERHGKMYAVHEMNPGNF